MIRARIRKGGGGVKGRVSLVLFAIGVMANGALCAQTLDRTLDHGEARSLARVLASDDINPAWRPGGDRAAGRGRYGHRPGPGNATGRDTSVDFTRSVGRRAPDERLRPLGIRLGAFSILPYVDVIEHYDSNVFRTETGARGDFITVVRPGIRIQSDWARHRLGLAALVEICRHADFTSENYEDIVVTVDGGLDARSDTQVGATVSFTRGHVDRSSPENNAASVEPKTYDRVTAKANVSRGTRLTSATVDMAATWTNFHDGETAAGTPIHNDDDDNLVLAPGFRVGYRPSPGNEVYVRSRYVETFYRNPTRDGGADRDDRGVDVLVGVTKNISDVWIGEVYVGYAPRLFDDPSLESMVGANAVVGGMDLLWNPTAVTSVMGTVTKTAAATTTAGASAISTLSAGLTAEHALRRAVLLDATVGITNDDYVGASRSDVTYRGGVGAEYRMNQWVAMDVRYDYLTRDSTMAGASHDRHAVGVGVTVRY